MPASGDAGVPGWTVSAGTGEPTPIAPTVTGGDLPKVQVDTASTGTMGDQTGWSGARSSELGKLGESGALGKLNAIGVNVETEVEVHLSIELSDGREVLPDFRVDNSQVGFRGIIETRWSSLRISDFRSVNQFYRNVDISKTTGLPLCYDLYSGADKDFQALFKIFGVAML